MAVRIPQYQQQTAPNSLGVQPRARGVQVDDSMARATMGVAQAIGTVADVYATLEANRLKQVDEDAKVWAGDALASSQLAQIETLGRMKSEAGDGAPEFARSYNTQFEEYEDAALANAPNDASRKYLQEGLQRLRVSMLGDAIQFEQGERQAWRVDTAAKANDTAAQVVAADPTQFQTVLAEQRAVIDSYDVPPDVKRRLQDDLTQKSSKAVAMRDAEADPIKALAISSALLGITEPTMRVSGGGNVRDQIIKLESGGRLYGEDGEILKGPAITTQDGQTIYAYGKYQLLESTAQETAGSIGVPWKPEVFLRAKTGDPVLDAETAEYHDLLGQAYIQQQDEQFGGNPVLIAAAHNMGPAATQGWAAGTPYQTQSGKWWYPSKPMDMAAMPAETRKYIEGLGAIDEAPMAPVDPGDPATLPYRLLSPQELLATRSAAQSRLAEQNRANQEQIAVQRVLFKQRITDLETAAKAGDPIEIPSDGELTVMLGPGEAALTKTRLLGLQQMSGALKSLPGMSNAQLTAMANMPDPEGSENRENNQFVRDTISKQAQATLTARLADPGAAANESSPQVQAAYSAWQQAATEAQSGGQITPEIFDKVNAAQAAYVTASFTQQRQWGIAEPKLPKEFVEGVSNGFRVQMENGNVIEATAQYQALPAQLGSYEAIRQIGDKTGDIGWFAMEGVSPTVINQLGRTRAIKPEDANKLLPTNVKPGDVADEVNNAFAPLLATFAAPGLDMAGDAETASRYQRAGITLATSYLVSGQASTAKEAAQMAYQSLYSDRETIIDGVRVPNSYDASRVSQGLRNRVLTLPSAEMYAPQPLPGLTVEQTQERIARNVRTNGRWVTNETGDGAYLMVAGIPALNSAGKPISMSFDAATTEQGPVMDADWGSLHRNPRLRGLERGLR